ncbi:nif-specific regulatory protein-like [Macaca nemestrina]|uniref:nif-specific regulatory protein-like n=1 Tax=Macaca nemestrina TaxID=9545 RepID=UPI0039B97F9B
MTYIPPAQLSHAELTHPHPIFPAPQDSFASHGFSFRPTDWFTNDTYFAKAYTRSFFMLQGAQPHTPSPACRPSPPISGACAPDPAGADPWGRPGFLFLPGPAPPPPGSTAAGSPGPRREEGTHLVGVTCCFGPSVPSRSRRRPQSPAPSPAQARPPHPRPAPGRPTGGRDRVLLGSFRNAMVYSPNSLVIPFPDHRAHLLLPMILVERGH